MELSPVTFEEMIVTLPEQKLFLHLNEWHRLWQWFKVFSVDFMQENIFHSMTLKSTFFPQLLYMLAAN